MNQLFPGEEYRAKVPCARVFRFSKEVFGGQALASQTGILSVTSFRVRFTPFRCSCASLQELGPPNWHSGGIRQNGDESQQTKFIGCPMRGPVTAWGSAMNCWPISQHSADEMLATHSKQDSQQELETLDVRYHHDAPLFAIKKVSCSGREVSLTCRDIRVLHFELMTVAEVEGLVRILTTLCFPKNEICGAFAFLSRHRCGLGWDVLDLQADARRTIESRSRISLKVCESPCPSYPEWVWIPKDISASQLANAASFRTRLRHPTTVYAHRTNGSLLVRCSQPLVGFLGNRNPQDENLVRHLCGENYLVLDARSQAAAFANRAIGKGTEAIDRGYQGAMQLLYADLCNIHQIKACALSLELALEKSNDVLLLESSGRWLGHCSALLKASFQIVSFMDRKEVSVLTHCSDGWDRVR